MNGKTNIFDLATDGFSPPLQRSRQERLAIQIITTMEWAILASVPLPEALATLYRDRKPWLKKLMSIMQLVVIADASLFILAFVLMAMDGTSIYFLKEYGFQIMRTFSVIAFFLAYILFHLVLPYLIWMVCSWVCGWICMKRKISSLIAKLQSGISLTDSIIHSKIRGFPGHVIPILREAERVGRLNVVIPMLARQMRYETSVRLGRMSYWPLIVTEASVLLFLLVGMNQRIMPVFGDMGSDFGVTTMNAFIVMMKRVQLVFLFIMGMGLVLYMLTGWERWWERLVQVIPLVRQDWKRRQLRQLAQSVYVYLQCGHDVTSAVQMSLSGVRDGGLRKKLTGFVERVRAGESWGRAWDGMQLEPYAYSWLVINAAHREDPLTGFRNMADWIHGDISHTTQLIQRWLLPCVAVVLSVFVGFVAYNFHACLHATWQAVY